MTVQVHVKPGSRVFIHALSICLVFLLSACTDSPSNSETNDFSATEIILDQWNVPHIYAQTRTDAFYAFGWSQMRNHANLILRLYAQARGEAAAHLGADYLDSDTYVQTLGGPLTAHKWLEQQQGDYQDYLLAFAEGMNDYATDYPDAITPELKTVLPITAVDPLAHIIRVIYLKFMTGDAYNDVAGNMGIGSNGLALAPSRSEKGNAMLLINPHLPWSDYFVWMESHIVTPDLNAYGVTLVGMPHLGIAINPHLGWTHTVNMFDGVDHYALTLEKDGYLLDGEVRPFSVENLTLRVKQSDGEIVEHTIQRRISEHGPVLSKDGSEVAVRLVGLDAANMVKQYWDMAAATNLREFEAAIARQQMPFFNTLYADKYGEIFYLYGGIEPDRKFGDWQYWQQVLPGDKSDHIWQTTLGYSALPKLSNPPSGFIQNANDAPWSSTFPFALTPEDYSERIAPAIPPHYRAQRALNMVLSDDKFSMSELSALRADTRIESADRYLPDLIAAARDTDNAELIQAANLLSQWNRRTDPDSRGAVLFINWLQHMLQTHGDNWSETPWDANQPLSTPKGLADKNSALAALSSAVEQIKQQFGSIDVAYGEVYRIRFAGQDLPASVGYDDYGIFRAGYFKPEQDGTWTLVGGNTFVAVVEFGEQVQAEGLLPYGNVTQSQALQTDKQLQLFSQGKLRPLYIYRPDVEKNAKRVISLQRPMKRVNNP